MRTSASRDSLPPTGVNFLSWSTRKSLDWRVSGMSPISSRKIVPPCAASNRPGRLRSAPVKAPFSWPKSSDSRRFSGIAEQFSATKGLSDLELKRCRAEAISSLPVPLSPKTKTDESERATLATVSRTRSIAWLRPMISGKQLRQSSIGA